MYGSLKANDKTQNRLSTDVDNLTQLFEMPISSNTNIYFSFGTAIVNTASDQSFILNRHTGKIVIMLLICVGM